MLVGVEQGSAATGMRFNAAGNLYVGQADCTGDILRFAMGRPPTAYAVAAENRGSFWIDLARDGCTIFFTSERPT